jgi:hypothetical protein
MGDTSCECPLECAREHACISQPFDSLVFILREVIEREEGGKWSDGTAIGTQRVHMLLGKRGVWSCGPTHYQEQSGYLFSVQAYSDPKDATDWPPPVSAESQRPPDSGWIRLIPGPGNTTVVHAGWSGETWQQTIEGLAALLPPKPMARPKLGLHGGTLDRVREARELVEQGLPKTTACKRVGIDPRTYDRYVDQFVDWESEQY